MEILEHIIIVQVKEPLRCNSVTYVKDNNIFDTDAAVGTVWNGGAQGVPQKPTNLNVKEDGELHVRISHVGLTIDLVM